MVWIIISSILLVVLVEWISTNIGFPKLKFSSFKKFYTLNPNRWGFGDGYVICKSDVDGFGRRKDYFAFSFVDFYRYKLWYKKLEKDDKKNRDAESLACMIAAVKKDIESTEVDIQRYYKKATNIIQEVSSNDE